MAERSAGALVVGAGPAGLAAAGVLAAAGHPVVVADAAPAPGRKLLVAGKSGLNLTHSEPHARFVTRFLGGEDRWGELLGAYGPAEVRAWAASLGFETYVGSSGRVFPVGDKAAGLLLAWIRRLKAAGTRFLYRHRLVGLGPDGGVTLSSPAGPRELAPGALVLALGGASWPQTGSDGAWAPLLAGLGVPLVPFAPSNCGFDADWPEGFAARFARQPIKNVALEVAGRRVRGDLMVTPTGVEGGPVYAHAAALRERVPCPVVLDLKPDLEPARMVEKLVAFRGKGSLGRRAGLAWRLDPAARALLGDGAGLTVAELAGRAKAFPLTLTRPRPLAEAISTAGGVAFEAVDRDLMLRARPGTFVAGEMLAWDAPTGGYLLTGCLATGTRAGAGAARWLEAQP